MSTPFYDLASLVVVPSGYKNGKIYAQKPQTTDGQLAFTRASSATRVQSNGLIEKVRTNLVLQSQAFNTTWAVNAAPTITANTTVAPDGTTTADTIAATASYSGVYQSSVNVSNGVEHSWSVYIKNISSASNIFVGIASNPSNASLNYNATSGTITSSGAGLAASSATNVGNGWYRLSGTYVTTGTTTDFVIYGMGTMSFAVWGAQLETGVTTAYIATTTAAVSVGPVSGLPRLDYLGSTCGKLLLEPQRTNLQTNSENGTGTNWGNTLRVNVTANQVASPDGYVNADSIADTAANGTHWFETSFSATSGTAYTLSFFAKANTLSQVTIYGFSDNGVFTLQQAIFNVSNGTVVSNTGGGTTNVVNYGNGWYRVSLTLTSGATATGYLGFGLAKNGSSSYTGNGSSLYMWGIQLEAGAYATSYIPTLGASVTRVEDLTSKTGISSLIGQTEGTIFMDVNLPNNAGNDIFTFASTGVNDIFLASNGGNLLTRIYSNSTALFFAQYAITAAGGRFKMAIAYKSGDSAFYVNGTLVGTNAGSIAFSATLSDINLTNNQYAGRNNKNINQALLFKTRLTNAQLAELTAL